MIEAHYTTGKQPYVCFAITTNGDRVWLETQVQVSNKREARQIAKQYNAQPWNF